MKYLITGGAGFIGSHLAEALLNEGHEVFIIDDLSTGAVENIDHLKDNPSFHYTIDSIMNTAVMNELVDRCDVIFHMAAAVGVSLIVESPVRTIETNIHGTELILRLAAVKKKKVIIASTSEVYGKSESVPFKEDDDMVLGPTTKGRWSYACSKAVDEFLALSYWKEKRLPVVIVRFFNTVGPRQVGHYGMVIPRFVQQALKGGPITVYGDGAQSRCFGYVTDVVRAAIALSREAKAVGNVFNIGSTEEITILDLAKKVRDMVNPSIKIEFVPYNKAYEEGFEDLRRRVPDVSKIKNLIGFSPTENIDGILRKVIEYERGRNAVKRKN